MEIKIEKITEIVDKHFIDLGCNRDNQSERILWIAAGEAIKEILEECKVEVVFPKPKPIMENKIKKHQLILSELKRRRKENNDSCEINNCPPTLYMKGSNRILDEMIVFIEKLQ